MSVKGTTVNYQTINSAYIHIKKLMAGFEEDIDSLVSNNKAMNEVLAGYDMDEVSKSIVDDLSKKIVDTTDRTRARMETISVALNEHLAKAQSIQSKATATATQVTERAAATKGKLGKR